MNKNIRNIIELINGKYEMDISVYHKSFIEKTINNRIVATSSKSVKEYLDLLNSSLDESKQLKDSFKNAYSEFFRNTNTFALLEQFIIPKIISEKEKFNSHEIRIWSAGCASGQEPYSLAILAADYINTRSKNIAIRIFATDNSEKELEAARLGEYDFNTLRNSKLGFVNKYFSVKDKLYLINKEIKDLVDFSFYDLLDKNSGSPPSSIYGGFDLIFCGNVLLYYNQEIKNKIIKKIHNSLNENGFFITGEAEIAIIKSAIGFRQYFPPAGVFQKK
jgi:chemotaxis protein methyltransferase CheR